jgi:hypothetical protein
MSDPERVQAIHDRITLLDQHHTTVDLIRQEAVVAAFAAEQKAIQVAFTAQQTSLAAALLSQKEAVAIALVAAEKAVNAALLSSAQAVSKAESAAERRFDSVNEFRETIGTQQRLLMPRAEVEVLVSALGDKVDQLTINAREKASAAFGLSAGWQFAVGVIGVLMFVIGIASFFLRNR